MRLVRACVMVFSIVVCVGVLPGYSQSEKILRLKKVEGRIQLDGIIDPVWGQADSVTDFIQFRPYWDREPSRRMMAKVLTTVKALYALIVCWDERENVQTNTGTLDDHNGDICSLMLDTFGDRRTAYKFAVTASGVRADCRLLDDARNRDYNWDGVWFSGTRVYDWGFVIEMEIPYRTIQYDENLAEWGLDFDRWRPKNGEDVYWCQYEENEGQRISKFGTLLFEGFRPSVKGLNLEVYPVGIGKVEGLDGSQAEWTPNAGIDVFYNPSQKLTFQLTGNPDFAQIEADPYTFNITRYETYYNERRPFFTEGNEVFMPSGAERGFGFYRPMEIFYSRRIGKKLADGSEIPLLLGTRAFGRFGNWEYGGFLAWTDEKEYFSEGTDQKEPEAVFGSVRLTRQILGNSSIGLLYVGREASNSRNGVLDVDGAFRGSDWQFSYQLARSYREDKGDYAASFGLMMPKPNMILGVKGRYVGEQFDIDDVGFVPWRGTAELTALGGPMWIRPEGTIRQVMLYAGGSVYWEKIDDFVDRVLTLGLNMQFRRNWGYEVNLSWGQAKDLDQQYQSWSMNFSNWYSVSPKWYANISGRFNKTYNFYRGYLGYFGSIGSEIGWNTIDILQMGTIVNVFAEWDPDNRLEDVTLNSRPYVTLTPVNNLSLRLYVDNVFTKSSERIQSMITGFLFSYNFRPKSWIYLAINDVRDRSVEFDGLGALLPNRLHPIDRVGVFKIKYLFYF